MTFNPEDVVERYAAFSKARLSGAEKQAIWSQLQQRMISEGRPARSRRRPKLLGSSAAAVAGLLVVAGFAYGVSTHFGQVANQPAKTSTPHQYPKFTPPKDMTQVFQIRSNSGDLRVVGYAGPQEPYMYAQQLYVLTEKAGATPRVLYHRSALNDYVSRDQIVWYGEGSAQYLAFMQGVAITTFEAGGALTIERFAKSGQDNWSIQPEVRTVMPGVLSLYKLDAEHLLLEAAVEVGIRAPIEYTLTDTGVTQRAVADPSPKPGEIADSVTRTLYVNGTPASGGGINYKLTGDLSPLRMRLGQKLVLRVIYNTNAELPLAFLLYPDVGDPGPGSLADRDPSPYTNARVFTLVHTAKHGQVVIEPEILPGVKAGPQTTKGPIKIPIIVQR